MNKDILKCLQALCEALNDFAYFSELPKAKELRKATDDLWDVLQKEEEKNG